jgi:hypothetical protein
MSESKKNKIFSIMATVFLTFMIANPSLAKLSYENLVIRPFDTSKETPGRVYNGTAIKLSNVKLYGKPLKKDTITFEFGGGYGQKVRGIEFFSKRTFSNMPQSISEGSYGNGTGYKFFLGKNITSKASNIFNKLDPEDKLIFKAICGALSDKIFVKKILTKMKTYTPTASYQPINLSRYKKYWAMPSRLNETIKIANDCNRGLKNIGAEKVKFNLSEPPKLCGVSTTGILLNSRTFKSIQSDLKLLGHYNGKIDGLFGAGSCKSLAAYNSSIGKTVLTYYTKFYINSLRERAKSVSTVIPQKSKETESEAAILAAAKKEAAEIIEAAKKEAAILEAAKKEAAEIVEAAKKEADENNELSASNILLADNISDEAALSPSIVIVEEKELKENIFQIEKLTELQEIVLKADTFLMEYNKDQAGKLMRYKLRLMAKGSEIDTSLVSKSIFGFENSSSIDISMSIGSSQAALDFIIDEENTKINLHFSDEASVNKDFASNIPELILDASEISGAFFVRIIDDGSNNIQSGDFAQILEKLDPKDVALVGAFCSVIQSISADKNTFIKSVTQNIPDESKDGFSSSPLVSDGVIKIINSHATACVGELEKVNNIKASFDIPNLFNFEGTGETLLESSSENVLEKSRAELKEIEIADQKRLKEEQRIEEERLAKAAQIAEQQRIARVKQELKAAKEQKEKRLAEKERKAQAKNKLLKAIFDRKWQSSEQFPCNFNGGTYTIYSPKYKMGYANAYGGELGDQTPNNTKSEFEYINEKKIRHTMSIYSGGNQFMTQLLGTKARLAYQVNEIEMLSQNKLKITRIDDRRSNFDLAQKGIYKEERGPDFGMVKRVSSCN